jgi:hypothetical protein
MVRDAHIRFHERPKDVQAAIYLFMFGFEVEALGEPSFKQ